MADPDHKRYVLRHRNIFEPDSGQSKGDDRDNTFSDGRENPDGEKPAEVRLETESGKPCKVAGCRCICQHHHFLYGTIHNPRTAFVTTSRDHCPEKGHGLND